MPAVLPSVGGDDTVTDARFPDRWMLDRRVMTLPPDAFRAYVLSLTWSVSNRTDGLIHPAELALVPGGVTDTQRSLFVEKDLWAKQGDAWLILDFDTTQTSAAQLRSYEEQSLRERDRKREKRATKKPAGDGCPPAGRPDSGPPRKASTGQATTGREVGEVGMPSQRARDNTDRGWET